jgi:hypothetical protein
MDDVTQIIDDFRRVCKKVQPDLTAHDGSITVIYKRNSFEDLWEAIGELYYTLVASHIPTKYLNIDVAYHTVKIKLDYKGLKVLFPVYGEEEE